MNIHAQWSIAYCQNMLLVALAVASVNIDVAKPLEALAPQNGTMNNQRSSTVPPIPRLSTRPRPPRTRANRKIAPLAVLLAACNPGTPSRSFNFQAIPDVPPTVNALGKLIGQQQRDVVTPGGDQFHPGFSAEDQRTFETSHQLEKIVASVTGNQIFTDGVETLAGLPAPTQTRVYAAYATPIDRTWAENGRIGDGVTDAGKAVESEIAIALTSAVEAAVRAHSSGGQPAVSLTPPSAGATQLFGNTFNCNPATTKVVIYALKNMFYVQPSVADPFTNIGSNGAWSNTTHPWEGLVVLLVDPTRFTPPATLITQPALEPGVLAYTTYPETGPISLQLSGRTFGIKVTGSDTPADRFDPGPNYFSNDPKVVYLAADGLHLKTALIDGTWRCSEVYLTKSLGYGTYTVQVNSALDRLDRNTVAAPLFIYDKPGAEFDFEFSGVGGLVESPNTAQFVTQPYNVPGNIVRYLQPSVAQFTLQADWRADHITFKSWTGWSAVPGPGDVIYEWTYNGPSIPNPGTERVHFSNWLLGGAKPINGVGDELVIHAFEFVP